METSGDMSSHDTDTTNDISAIYNNHPLGSQKNTTRMLRILPQSSRNPSSLIACQLSVVSLNEAPDYRAVSYVWGDPSVTKLILVDGQLFTVRINLWDFLAQMQHEEYHGLLWIDAICIDQANLNERSEQVAIMGTIYSKATEVRGWLGVGTANNHLGMQRRAETDWLQIFTHLDDLESQHGTATDPRILGSKGEQCWLQFAAMTSDVSLQPIAELLEAKYWWRIWIVQECGLACALVIQCGPFTINSDVFKDFDRFAIQAERVICAWRIFIGRSSREQWLSGRKLVKKFNDISDYAGDQVLNARKERKQAKSQDIFAWSAAIFRFRKSQCVDFHDYVYALLPLNDFAFANITPDYRKSKIELFQEVGSHFVRYFEQGFGEYRSVQFRETMKILAENFGLSEEHEKVKGVLDRLRLSI